MAKAGNLLAILWLLRSRRRMTANQIAGEREISVRTVYRYIDDLCASGVPVLAEAGHEGGYSLPDSFRGAPLFFEPDELVRSRRRPSSPGRPAIRTARRSGRPWPRSART